MGRLQAVLVFFLLGLSKIATKLIFLDPVFARRRSRCLFRSSTNSRGKIGTARSLKKNYLKRNLIPYPQIWKGPR